MVIVVVSGMAGTTGLEPATSGVTGSQFGSVKSVIQYIFNTLQVRHGDMGWHSMPYFDAFTSRLLHTDAAWSSSRRRTAAEGGGGGAIRVVEFS